MTITSGTGNSRTLILRTTTSGGAATTALTLGATQGAVLVGDLAVSSTTSSSYSTTGSGTFGGGLGVAENLYVGGREGITGKLSIANASPSFTSNLDIGSATDTATFAAYFQRSAAADLDTLYALPAKTSRHIGIRTSGDLFYIGRDAAVNDITISSAGVVNLINAATVGGKISSYNAVSTVGWGVPAIYGTGRSTAQTTAVASVATYTVGAADGTFEITGNINVTVSSAEAFAFQVTYTDEGNVARTATLPSFILAGTSVAQINFANGTGPYAVAALCIRCKASTAITVKTAGTFTGCTYNVEGTISQIA